MRYKTARASKDSIQARGCLLVAITSKVHSASVIHDFQECSDGLLFITLEHACGYACHGGVDVLKQVE
jgi:hypothetical protein